MQIMIRRKAFVFSQLTLVPSIVNTWVKSEILFNHSESEGCLLNSLDKNWGSYRS